MKDESSRLTTEYGLTAGESMAATNTVSVEAPKHAMTAPGSASVDPPPSVGASHDTPGLGISVTHAKPTTTGKYSEGVPHVSLDWKKAGE